MTTALDKRITELVDVTGKTKEYYEKAVLEPLEDAQLAEQRYLEAKERGIKPISSDEMRQRLGLDG
ncbi:MAG: CopG family transcriptional regulator [Dethiosulfovibrio peptidovorans]|nr:MAG: CopG family transcriptional regulator [Dethiosulfovibrio peptidovorans]